MSLKIKLFLCLISYFIWGIGLACQMWGIKAGLSLQAVITIFVLTYVQFIAMVFTILDDVKKAVSPKSGEAVQNPSSIQ